MDYREMAKQLEKNGLILRQVDPSDNRQLIVIPTEEGMQMAEQVCDQLLSRACNMLEALGPEDSMEYLRIQQKILNHFDL